uniref:AAA+ ATPase domain-containing protein n=1 Tax=viral metagenome TaxID=1070528 RepID=A0A6C0FEA8_9ZZZZ
MIAFGMAMLLINTLMLASFDKSQYVNAFGGSKSLLGIKSPFSARKLKMSFDYTQLVKAYIGKGVYGSEWTFNELVHNINKNNVEYASILDNANYVIAIDKRYEDIFGGENMHYIKTLPQLTSKIIDLLNSHHIHFNIYSLPTQNPFLGLISNAFILFGSYFTLMLIIQTIRILMMRSGRGSGDGGGGMNPMNFFSRITSSSSRIIQPGAVNTTFANVAGCNEAKNELIEVVDFLKNPNKFKDAGAVVPKGVLLEGPPGTGKTLLARATAGEANVTFISASGSEFIEMFVGVGASRIRDLFEDARRHKPSIVFIDEIDAIGRQRGNGFSGGNDERDQTLNQLLTNMDGFDKESEIVVLASTNRADILDKALVRPGRFDRKVTVGLPDKDGRKEILDVHLKGKRVAMDVDLEAIYELTPGFSGADLSNLANEAAIMSVRYNLTHINNKCFMDAYEKVTIGLPKLKDNRDHEIRKMVAYHESGHAIVAKMYKDFVDVRKVTINANNNGAGGYTLFTPKERYVSFPTKNYMFASMVIAMAGRAAEIILYGDTSENTQSGDNVEPGAVVSSNYKYDFPENDGESNVTLGSSGDVRQATEIARQYISVFGAEGGLGAGSRWDEQSEKVKAQVDERIAELIEAAQKKAVEMLRGRKNDLKTLSELLLKEGTVSGNVVP